MTKCPRQTQPILAHGWAACHRTLRRSHLATKEQTPASRHHPTVGPAYDPLLLQVDRENAIPFPSGLRSSCRRTVALSCWLQFAAALELQDQQRICCEPRLVDLYHGAREDGPGFQIPRLFSRRFVDELAMNLSPWTFFAFATCLGHLPTGGSPLPPHARLQQEAADLLPGRS